MTTKEILQGALALFGPNGENWTNECPYKEGRECAVTALYAASKMEKENSQLIALKVLAEQHKPEMVTITWNFTATWPEVKQAFLKAIEAAQ